MDWFPFHHPTDNFGPFVRWLENFFGHAEGSPYNQRTHFPVLSEKFFRSKERGLRFCSKMSFHYSTDRMNRSVTILSHRRFPLYFTTDIFPQKLGTPFQKNFSCSWFPLYLAKRIRGRFCPRFLEKVSETAKQSLCIASNCPFYFPTDKMMRRVTVLS